MKVLFIGGTGTLSSACVRACLNEGMDLWLLLRGTRNHRLPQADNLRILSGDVKSDPACVKGLLEGHTWDCVVDWIAYEEEDLIRDIELFHHKTKKFVFISSCSVYKKPLVSPFVNEETLIGNEFWDYADKKAKCEQFLMDKLSKLGFPTVIVRACHTYSEFTLPSGIQGMGFGILKRMLNDKPILVHGDGTGLWTLMFNEDFAKGFVPLMIRDDVIGETFQIASEELLTWQQIYEFIAVPLGLHVKFKFVPSSTINKLDPLMGATLLGDKAHSHIFDISKIKRYVPSFSPSTKFSCGVTYSIDWYKKNKSTIFFDQSKDQWMDDVIRKVHGRLN